MTSRRRRGTWVSTVAVMLLLVIGLTETAHAAVTVSRAEVSGSRLRIEGRAIANRAITVDGVRMATSSSSGSFKVDRSGYTRPADCTVDVNDGSATARSVQLSGCTVTAPPPGTSVALATMTISPTSVQGGGTASATVTLSAPAPAGGVTVTFASTNPAVASVPSTMTVPAGVDSRVVPTFVTTSAVSSTSTASISATHADVTRATVLTVTSPPPAPPPAAAVALDTMTISPASVQGGGTASATVTLTAPAPAGGVTVSFASTNPAVASVPSTMTVPAGVNSRVVPTFVTTSAVSSTSTASISATYADVTRATVLTVTAPPPPQPGGQLDSISLSPSTVQTGTTQSSATLFFTTLTASGGATVSLSSSNTSVATVPASVTVPGFSSTGAFSVAIRSSAVGTATISATYNGLTRTAVLTVQSATLFRIITESPLPPATVGANYAGFIEACCGQGTPYRWSLVSGTVPDGLEFAGDDLRLSRTTAVTGVPTRVQTTTFTVRARDGAGNTATRTFTLSVGPADPLVITNQSDALPDGQVGVIYETGVFPGGGVPPYTWSHVGGTLPPGLFVQASPGRVKGTPTTAGTFIFTLRVDDSDSSFATRQFGITVNP